MTPLCALLGAILVLGALWLAYKVGKALLRILAGLLLLGGAGYLIWRCFLC